MTCERHQALIPYHPYRMSDEGAEFAWGTERGYEPSKSNGKEGACDCCHTFIINWLVGTRHSAFDQISHRAHGGWVPLGSKPRDDGCRDRRHIGSVVDRLALVDV